MITDEIVYTETRVWKLDYARGGVVYIFGHMPSFGGFFSLLFFCCCFFHLEKTFFEPKSIYIFLCLHKNISGGYFFLSSSASLIK